MSTFDLNAAQVAYLRELCLIDVASAQKELRLVGRMASATRSALTRDLADEQTARLTDDIRIGSVLIAIFSPTISI